MYYGYRCYTKDNEPLGWLYLSGYEYTWTNRDFHLCKRWKTLKGAEKNFDTYNSRWQFKSKGGYLKIEVMPEFTEYKSLGNQQNCQNKTQTQILFSPDENIVQWLEQERCTNDDGEPESYGEVLNRKLTELMKLGKHSKQ